MVELVSTMPPHEIVSILKRNLGFGPKLANRTAGLLIRHAKKKRIGEAGDDLENPEVIPSPQQGQMAVPKPAPQAKAPKQPKLRFTSKRSRKTGATIQVTSNNFVAYKSTENYGNDVWLFAPKGTPRSQAMPNLTHGPSTSSTMGVEDAAQYLEELERRYGVLKNVPGTE